MFAKTGAHSSAMRYLKAFGEEAPLFTVCIIGTVFTLHLLCIIIVVVMSNLSMYNNRVFPLKRMDRFYGNWNDDAVYMTDAVITNNKSFRIYWFGKSDGRYVVGYYLRQTLEYSFMHNSGAHNGSISFFITDHKQLEIYSPPDVGEKSKIIFDPENTDVNMPLDMFWANYDRRDDGLVAIFALLVGMVILLLFDYYAIGRFCNYLQILEAEED